MIPSKDLRIQSTCDTLLTYKNFRCGRVVSFRKVAESRNSPINIECVHHKGSLQKSIFFLHSPNFARNFCFYRQKCVDNNISQGRRKLLLTFCERLSPTSESRHERYWIWTLDPPHFVAYHVSLPTGIVPETIFESRKSEKNPTFRLSDFDIVTSLTEQVDCGNTVHIVSTLQMVTPDQTQCRSHILT